MADGRSRILVAAWDLMKSASVADVTLAAVAKRAGVSRQAVYLFFGSRGGLLTAVIRHHDLRSGIARKLRRAAQNLPPAEAVGTVIDLWFSYLPEIHPFAIALQAAAATDEEARQAWEDRMSAIRAIFQTVADRLENTAILVEGWSAGEAADFMWAQAHIATWQHLVVERGWTTEQASRRVSEAIGSMIVEPGQTL